MSTRSGITQTENPNLQDPSLMADTLISILAKLLPRGGSAYLHEGNSLEPSWQELLYGVNHEELVNTRNKHDPNSKIHLFGGTASSGK